MISQVKDVIQITRLTRARACLSLNGALPNADRNHPFLICPLDSRLRGNDNICCGQSPSNVTPAPSIVTPANAGVHLTTGSLARQNSAPLTRPQPPVAE